MTDQPNVCGYEKTTPTGMRWVCVKPPHDGDGDPIPTPNEIRPPAPNKDRHYFVRVKT